MSIRFHGKVKCKIIISKNAKKEKKRFVRSKSSTMKFLTMKFLKHQHVEKKVYGSLASKETIFL